MLLIASETIRANRTLNDVVREMSFTLSFFASPAKFRELMQGQSRRIVLLTEALNEMVDPSGRIGVMMGKETHLRMPLEQFDALSSRACTSAGRRESTSPDRASAV